MLLMPRIITLWTCGHWPCRWRYKLMSEMSASTIVINTLKTCDLGEWYYIPHLWFWRVFQARAMGCQPKGEHLRYSVSKRNTLPSFGHEDLRKIETRSILGLIDSTEEASLIGSNLCISYVLLLLLSFHIMLSKSVQIVHADSNNRCGLK